MPMLGRFRQVSPALLVRIKADPALAEQVVGRPAAGAATHDVEALLSFLPAHIRKSIDRTRPATRADILAHMGRAFAGMSEAMRQRVATARRPEAPGPADLDPSELGPELDLEEAWHAVRFLLWGSGAEAGPQPGDVVTGGQPVGRELGQGPLRYLEADQVTAVANALEPIAPTALAERFSAARLEDHGIHPGGWSDDGRRDWIREAYSRLRDFYLDAARNGRAVLFYVA